MVSILVLLLEFQGPGEEKIQGHQHFGVGVIELVFQLPLGVKWIVHDRHRPDPESGIIGDHNLGDVGKEHGHLVTLFHSQIQKGSGKTVHKGFQFPKRDFLAHI